MPEVFFMRISYPICLSCASFNSISISYLVFFSFITLSMRDRSRLGLALVAHFSLLFLFAAFYPIGRDIGDVVSYSSTLMVVSGLEDGEYAPKVETLLLFEELSINYACHFGSSSNNQPCSTANVLHVSYLKILRAKAIMFFSKIFSFN